MAKKLVKVMNTAFRDGFQSCLGARVITKDFIPAIEASKAAGIGHFEFGGGARFQSLFFYCNESAFDMMDTFREVVGPDANLQTLGRGINVVALDSQPSDIIELHAKMFQKHGTTTIRNFDALNDVNNLVYAGQMIHKYGLKHEICITLMALPPGCEGAHTAEFYMKTLDEILAADVAFDSLCFKDASGTAVPKTVYDTIKQARKKLGEATHIRLHTHETAGISISCYQAALEAGADGIDLSLAPMSGGTCQPDFLTMWHALRGTDYDLGVDIEKVLEAEKIFHECMDKYELLPEGRLVEPLIPWSPMPGGALTANTQMLRELKMFNKYPQIFAKMGECVRRGGFGTSVTPVSQFYFQQAFLNFTRGDWKVIAEGYGKMVLGYFGKTPVPADPEIVAIASKKMNLPPTTEDPRAMDDRNPNKGVAACIKMLTDAGIADLSEENIFIAATCKEKGMQFLKGEAKVNVPYKKKEEKKVEAKKPVEAPVAAC
jgi:pyruvate carboxylase subunit B